MKKHKLRHLENSQEKHMLLDDYEQELLQGVNELEDELMEIEMLLQDAMHNAMGQFMTKI
jgi:hypothetical protein